MISIFDAFFGKPKQFKLEPKIHRYTKTIKYEIVNVEVGKTIIKYTFKDERTLLVNVFGEHNFRVHHGRDGLIYEESNIEASFKSSIEVAEGLLRRISDRELTYSDNTISPTISMFGQIIQKEIIETTNHKMDVRVAILVDRLVNE